MEFEYLVLSALKIIVNNIVDGKPRTIDDIEAVKKFLNGAQKYIDDWTRSNSDG
jgi:hypothetical protein